MSVRACVRTRTPIANCPQRRSFVASLTSLCFAPVPVGGGAGAQDNSNHAQNVSSVSVPVGSSRCAHLLECLSLMKLSTLLFPVKPVSHGEKAFLVGETGTVVPLRQMLPLPLGVTNTAMLVVQSFP